MFLLLLIQRKGEHFMDMTITFPGGKKVEASYKGFTIQTDQPGAVGGDDSALEPFSLFLVSLGTCAGYYILSFCQQRNIPTQDIHLVLHIQRDKTTHMVTEIETEIHVPHDFPETYLNAVVKASETCAVRKHIEYPPQFHTKIMRP